MCRVRPRPGLTHEITATGLGGRDALVFGFGMRVLIIDLICSRLFGAGLNCGTLLLRPFLIGLNYGTFLFRPLFLVVEAFLGDLIAGLSCGTYFPDQRH